VAAERRLAAAHARIGVATAEYYPRISLSALAGFQASSASSLLTGSASVIQEAAGLRWRLFDFGRIRAEIADAKGSERSALAAYQQSVLRAATDVETAAALYTAGRERMAMHEIECASAAHARELLDQAWKAGQIDLSAVIEGDRRLLQGLDALAVARGETARAIVSVYRAIGA
jgi:outer membrane protein TolC